MRHMYLNHKRGKQIAAVKFRCLGKAQSKKVISNELGYLLTAVQRDGG